jgi:hypothetical protein
MMASTIVRQAAVPEHEAFANDDLLHLVVLQRLVGVTPDGRRRWRTIANPVGMREGLAQLDVVIEDRREHRLLQGVPEAWARYSVTLD